ncbi:hypothetical protein ACA910_000909 [Epithemia clementina (nom. ined.)]
MIRQWFLVLGLLSGQLLFVDVVDASLMGQGSRDKADLVFDDLLPKQENDLVDSSFYSSRSWTSLSKDDNTTHPTVAPTHVSSNTSNATIAPTVSLSPTSAPSTNASSASINTTSPVASPPSSAPSISPVAPNKTRAPSTAKPAPVPTKAPVVAPTVAPTKAAATPAAPHRMSIWRFIEKTIALCVVLVLSLLAFGAIMSNRYRIYFFLRGVWYTILGMECTGWIMRKLRMGDYQPVDPGLNTVIFEHEMDEGLLMRDSDGD